MDYCSFRLRFIGGRPLRCFRKIIHPYTPLRRWGLGSLVIPFINYPEQQSPRTWTSLKLSVVSWIGGFTVGGRNLTIWTNGKKCFVVVGLLYQNIYYKKCAGPYLIVYWKLFIHVVALKSTKFPYNVFLKNWGLVNLAAKSYNYIYIYHFNVITRIESIMALSFWLELNFTSVCLQFSLIPSPVSWDAKYFWLSYVDLDHCKCSSSSSLGVTVLVSFSKAAWGLWRAFPTSRRVPSNFSCFILSMTFNPRQPNFLSLRATTLIFPEIMLQSIDIMTPQSPLVNLLTYFTPVNAGGLPTSVPLQALLGFQDVDFTVLPRCFLVSST